MTHTHVCHDSFICVQGWFNNIGSHKQCLMHMWTIQNDTFDNIEWLIHSTIHTDSSICIQGWFNNIDNFERITREDIFDFIAWGFWGTRARQVPRAQRATLSRMVSELERACCTNSEPNYTFPPRTAQQVCTRCVFSYVCANSDAIANSERAPARVLHELGAQSIPFRHEQVCIRCVFSYVCTNVDGIANGIDA